MPALLKYQLLDLADSLKHRYLHEGKQSESSDGFYLELEVIGAMRQIAQKSIRTSLEDLTYQCSKSIRETCVTYGLKNTQDRHQLDALRSEYRDLPLLLNHEEFLVREIAKWRLKVGI